MTVYKRSLFVMLKGIIGAPCAGFVVYLVLSFFISDMTILLGAAAGITVLIWLMTILSDNIYFTISDGGEFYYYKRGKCREHYNLNECGIGYRQRSDGSTISLKVFTPDGQEHLIDAEPLGVNRFHKMYEKMSQFVQDDEVMTAKESEV